MKQEICWQFNWNTWTEPNANSSFQSIWTKDTFTDRHLC